MFIDFDADPAGRPAVEPSTMSLLGLVRHLADVERGWFRVRMAGQHTPPHFSGPPPTRTGTDPYRSARWGIHLAELDGGDVA
jgi:hypothetical protein